MGLVVVIVAGIIIYQLYFSYAAIISHRPAALIEYVDIVDSGSSAILAMNIKNSGNVPITGIRIEGDGINIEKMGLSIPPGRLYGARRGSARAAGAERSRRKRRGREPSRSA